MEHKKIEDLEYKISLLLRNGVFVSAFFLAIGLISSFFEAGRPLDSYGQYVAIPFFHRFKLALDERSWSTLSSYTGLIVLISLPLIRVFLTGYLFFRNKEKTMGTMAFIVFIILVSSFFLGVDL